jgi:hypothetical protein
MSNPSSRQDDTNKQHDEYGNILRNNYSSSGGGSLSMGSSMPDPNNVRQSVPSTSTSTSGAEFRYVLPGTNSTWNADSHGRCGARRCMSCALISHDLSFLFSSVAMSAMPSPLDSMGAAPRFGSPADFLNSSTRSAPDSWAAGGSPPTTANRSLGYAEYKKFETSSPNSGAGMLRRIPDRDIKSAPLLGRGASEMEKPRLEVPSRWNLDYVHVPPLPMYFQRDMIKLEMPMDDLKGVLDRVSRCFRHMSIQADYQVNPVSAKLQTMELIELVAQFWKSDEDNLLYIDIQRRKGDHLDANRYIHKILDAARGDVSEEDACSPSSLNARQVKDVESLIERVMSSAPAPAASPNWMQPQQTPEEITSNALHTVYTALTSKRLDMRRMGLEYLATYTNVNRTLSSTAIPSALVVLQGTPPLPKYAEECKTIQRILLRVIQNREFEGDEDYLQDMDVDSDLEVFFPSEDEGETKRGRAPYYVEYMSELFHLALTILVNSLEVVACFKDQLSFNTNDMVRAFMSTSQNVSGVDMNQTLMDCVQRADRKLSNGSLACQALRILAIGSPDVLLRLKSDSQAKEAIRNAMDVGDTRHALLKVESKKLLDVL